MENMELWDIKGGLSLEQLMQGQTGVEAEFLALTQDLCQEEQVQSMAQWYHHGKVNCLEHSLFVAVTAYRIGKKLHLDTSALARAGLLHDFYLYHKRDKSAHSGWQCVDHPLIAVENAKKITHLSKKEENIILSHMWPFCHTFPKSPEAVLVNCVDTLSAVLEFCGSHRAKNLSQRLMPHLEEAQS